MSETLHALDLRERSFNKPEKRSRSFAAWFVFGSSARTADLSDGEGDVLRGVPLVKVPAVLAARRHFLEQLAQILGDDKLTDDAEIEGRLQEAPCPTT